MKQLILPIVLFSAIVGYGQNNYDSSKESPFGKTHPEAPDQNRDFEEMIGLSDCKSIRRNPDGTWQDSVKMVWEFKYILNGKAVQDLTWIENGFAATSIRQYNPDSANWVVTYNSTAGVSNSPSIPWLGNRHDNKIELKKDQKAPNGMDGFNQLTFYNLTSHSFDWKGEWADTSGSVSYPFWHITCRKRT